MKRALWLLLLLGIPGIDRAAARTRISRAIWERVLQDQIPLVEELCGSALRSPPSIQCLAGDEFSRAVNGEVKRGDVVSQGSTLSSVEMFYSGRHNTIFIDEESKGCSHLAKNAEEMDLIMHAAILHETIHAWQKERLGVDLFCREIGQGDLVFIALIEGHAELIVRRYLVDRNRVDIHDRFVHYAEELSRTGSGPEVSFIYVRGRAFWEVVMGKKKNGACFLETVLRRQPLEKEILFPDLYVHRMAKGGRQPKHTEGLIPRRSLALVLERDGTFAYGTPVRSIGVVAVHGYLRSMGMRGAYLTDTLRDLEFCLSASGTGGTAVFLSFGSEQSATRVTEYVSARSSGVMRGVKCGEGGGPARIRSRFRMGTDGDEASRGSVLQQLGGLVVEWKVPGDRAVGVVEEGRTSRVLVGFMSELRRLRTEQSSVCSEKGTYRP